MTTIAILPVPNEQGSMHFCAVSNGKHSEGATVGAALDAMAAQLTAEESGTMIIVQNQQPDRFFSASQQRRLGELMEHWRRCRDNAETWPADEEAELKALIADEFRAAGLRAAAIADELK